MVKKKALTLLFLISTLAVLSSSCTRIKDPQFRRLEHFQVKNAGLQQVDVGVAITYFNPNSFSVSVKEAAGDLYVDSVFVGKFIQEAPVEVGRNAEFSIPLSASIPMQTLLQMNSSYSKNRKFHLKASGQVKIGKAGIYLSRPFTYEGDHQLNIQ